MLNAPSGWRPDAVAASLDSRWRTPVLLTTTGSTNDDCAQIAQRRSLATGEWLLVASAHQSAGRGRRGHDWSTEAGAGLLFSIATRLHVPAIRWPSASLVVGFAMIEWLRELLPTDDAIELGVKWPNDLLVGPAHRKLGGILCERVLAPEAAGDEALWIAGVGLNLRRPQTGRLPTFTAGLLELMPNDAPAEMDASALLGRVASRIQAHVDAWQLRGGFLLPEVHGAALRFCGVEVGLDLGDGRRVPAWLCGIDRTGALRVREVVAGRPTGPERPLTPLRILDAQTHPPWRAHLPHE